MGEFDKIEEVMKGLERLPSLPGVAVKILEAVRNKQTSLKEIADILSADPPLSVEVLKLINSSFYGLRTKVTCVSHAVNLMGLNAVKNIALSFSLIRQHRKVNGAYFDYTLFWKNSLLAAVTSKLIAAKVVPALAEDAFFLGLLHNIGILALSECMPDQYSLVIAEKERNLSSYHKAENKILGFTHMEVGGYLIRKWGLPQLFSIPVRHHHDPAKLETTNTDITTFTRILHLASLLIDFNNLPDKGSHLGLFECYAKRYGFLEEFEVDDMAKQIHQQTIEVFPIFEIKIEGEDGYIEMIEQTRKELVNLSTDIIKQLAENERLIESLKVQATRDALTNLFNYQVFQESLEKEVYRARRYLIPLSLIIADIDHFKKVNDTYGHLAGDHSLRTVAGCLEQSLRKSDTIARYGGEEFAIIMPDTSLEAAFAVAERLRQGINSLRIDHVDEKLAIRMSFGIACMNSKENLSKNELIRRADHALYNAKKTGRNRCCWFGEK